MERKYIWEKLSAEDKAEMNKTAAKYMDCISNCKTERECIRRAVSMAEAAGYRNLKDVIAEGGSLKADDKVYAVYNEKTMALYHIGEDPIENGMNILGAHVDSPRIDVKQNPVYENNGFAYFDAHYYGGIKKYQWVTIPLAVHGVIIRKDGTKVNVCVGENPDEPVFAITDILPHLGKPQMEKPAPKIIEGENLDLLIGSEPCKKQEGSDDMSDEERKAADSEPVRTNIIRILAEKYGIEEEDFLSAELEIVPADKAREMGFDRSMIIGYGQDDRICAFTSLFAMLETEAPKRTACCLLVDKEEIGSMGASGMQSRFFENSTAEVLALLGYPQAISLRRTLANSTMLSSDVSAGLDPLYADVFESKNSAYLGKGVVFNKYTGSAGKAGSSDANPEFIAAIRRVLDNNNVGFHTAELGKVDVGGGGTIAFIMANYGMEVIDCGLPILCMHAPMEISSKADVHEAVRAYKAFLKEMTGIY